VHRAGLSELWMLLDLAKSHGIIAGDKPIEINGQPAQIFLGYNQAGAGLEPS